MFCKAASIPAFLLSELSSALDILFKDDPFFEDGVFDDEVDREYGVAGEAFNEDGVLKRDISVVLFLSLDVFDCCCILKFLGVDEDAESAEVFHRREEATITATPAMTSSEYCEIAGDHKKRLLCS